MSSTAARASATSRASPSARMPTMAWLRKPTWSGSVTATICMIPASRIFWTRWRTAAVGLSEAAVRQRVQKMRDAGIMQIVAVTDPLQVGFRSQAMVGIRADGDAREVADALAAVDDIDYVVMVPGEYDILVELVCEDEDRLLELLNSVIRQIPGVRETEMFMYLKLKKQTYTWWTR